MLRLELCPGDEVPDLLNMGNCKVFLSDPNPAIDPHWQSKGSKWLISLGCRYCVAWGPNSSSWDDSVDWAWLEKYGFDCPDEADDCMTTWHNKEPRSEALCFFEYCAHIDDCPDPTIIILNIGMLGSGA